ncbi:MAG: acetyl-CoA acetyltransferase [Hyphomicrobiales bacterium]|nr:acetyl-CoA acetyltransferase [Hyphomicrobiales bacterium]
MTAATNAAPNTAPNAAIVGWAHTPFGKHDAETVESLIVRAANEALAHAGLDAADVDEIVLGHFNAGFSAQDFTASLVLQADPKLRFKPATRVENACATGSAAVHQAVRAIRAGAARTVLVVGVEQMTTTPGPQIGQNLLRASYLPEDGDTPAGFAGVFGQIAARYFQRHGDQSDALAAIAAKNHHNGVSNPYAQMRKDLGFAFCRAESEKNPFVAGPLKRTDCSLVSDGAAALVIADLDTAMTMSRAVAFKGMAHVQDFLPMSKRDILKFEGCALAWRKALEQAGIVLADLSFAETHDCFTIAELIEYEAMGLTGEGDGARAIREGWTTKDGRLPINPSGGLKSKGHPIGATGVSMHALSAMQLMGEAGDMQIAGARLGGIFNMGGAAVANYVSVLERAK